MSVNTKLMSSASGALFFTLVVIYASGYYQLVQSHIMLTLILTLFFPLIFFPLVKPVENDDEIKRILYLESGFNLVCFIMICHWVDVSYLDNALMVFFGIQTMGFIWVQLKTHAYLSVVISLCLGGAIAQWIHSGGNTLYLGSAELLLFGTPVPWQLKVIYGAWLIQLLFVEYKHVLPKMVPAAIHIASYTIAIFADDFFHARIITASHFLFLNLCFDFKSPNWGVNNLSCLQTFTKIVCSQRVQWSISGVMIMISVLSFWSLAG